VPALALVAYVTLWTWAMGTGYERQGLSRRIRQLRVENASLQAEVRRLQSPARILAEAEALDMERAADIEFVKAPSSSRVASGGGAGPLP
jgi:hypothetical protein